MDRMSHSFPKRISIKIIQQTFTKIREQKILEQLKNKFSGPSPFTSRKTIILTVAPTFWSVNRIVAAFRSIQTETKYPKPRRGRKLLAETENLVRYSNLREDSSRLIPSKTTPSL